MAAHVTHGGAELEVTFTGLDRVMLWRRNVRIDLRLVRRVTVERRDALERNIEHRASGLGTHDGERRPERRRVGTMLGRGAPGPQLWVVPAGPSSEPLLVLDVVAGGGERNITAVDGPVVRFVVSVDEGLAARVMATVASEQRSHPRIEGTTPSI